MILIFAILTFQYSGCGESRIRTYEGVRQQSYSLPQLATLVSPQYNVRTFVSEFQNLHIEHQVKKIIQILIILIFQRAESQIRTVDPEITNHVLWPTELIRQLFIHHVKTPVNAEITR